MNKSVSEKAYSISSHYHKGQMYGEKSYMYHLALVSFSVGADENSKAVAYLHDILEDTACKTEELSQMFPREIVEAVVAITKIPGEKYSDYINKVACNKLALHVKVHDTLCNLTESTKLGQWGRVRKYSEQLKQLTIHCGG